MFALKASYVRVAANSFKGFFPTAVPALFLVLGYWSIDCGSSFSEKRENSSW